MCRSVKEGGILRYCDRINLLLHDKIGCEVHIEGQSEGGWGEIFYAVCRL